MLSRYEKFLEDFDAIMDDLFKKQARYVKCKKGCSLCCETGNYPFSHLEFSYLTKGFISLPADKKIIVQKNIKNLVKQKKEFKGERFEHRCPFLIGNECCVYKYRGLVCRAFGIGYYDDVKDYVKLPECVHSGLNYSEFYDEKSHTLTINDVVNINLRIDRILGSKLAQTYNLDYGDIRPMLEWLEQK